MIPIFWISVLARFGAFFALLFVALGWFHLWRSASTSCCPPAKTKCPRQPLTPRPPTDCAACVASSSTVPVTTLTPPVRPWREVKSSHGRPKSIDTDGYACDYEKCVYRGMTDARIHAWVGYGHHGKDHSIQDFYCAACEHKFSARRHTVLYRLKTQAQRVGEMLASLAEGMAVGAAVRVFGPAESTI